MRKMFTQLVIVCLILGNLGTSIMAANITDLVVPRGFRFTTNMYKGQTVTPDIGFLQNILNMSVQTEVATTGPGSNQNLTYYYGDKTRAAVAKFQQVFGADINYEKQISTTTNAMSYTLNSSVIDQFTRAVLNKLVVIYTDAKYFSATSSRALATSTLVYIPPRATTTPIYADQGTAFSVAPDGILYQAINDSALVNNLYTYDSSTTATTTGYYVTADSSSGSEIGNILLLTVGAVVVGKLLSGAAGSAAGSAASGAATKAATSAVKPTQGFGGKTTAMITCLCSANVLLYVLDAKTQTTLPLIYQPGVTMLYSYYRPTTGVNVLGNYVTGGTCLIYAGTTCVSGGAPVGTMTQVGTSLTI